MPTPNGGETIGEALTRLRTELVRVRETIARHENNGQAFNGAGIAVTEIAYERATDRERSLKSEIAGFEARLAGVGGSSRMAQTQTRVE